MQPYRYSSNTYSNQWRQNEWDEDDHDDFDNTYEENEYYYNQRFAPHAPRHVPQYDVSPSSYEYYEDNPGMGSMYDDPEYMEEVMYDQLQRTLSQVSTPYDY